MRVRYWRRGPLCIGGILGAVLLGIALKSFHRAPRLAPPSPLPSERAAGRLPVDDDDFVGAEACGDCHTRIWDSYRRHPMGRSMAATREAAPIENYENTAFAPPGPRRYRVERTGDGVRHHESLADADGSLLYDQGVDVAYALGSGKRGRAYVIEHDGMLFKSSIAWFSRENAWGLAPDYAPDSHKRFERRITDGCVSCHAGRAQGLPSTPDAFAKPVIIEAAIGCERCHGPGRRHVEAHLAADDQMLLPQEFIVNPSRLDAPRQTAICAQCHLHGEATVLRTGQKPYDFQPGQLLEENRIVFMKPAARTGVSGRQALSQVEQMLNSACFLGSGGRLGCTSCHDPHGTPQPEDRVEYYRAKCVACHDSRTCSLAVELRLARQPLDSCVACHMAPSLQLANILHVSFADHRILREPQAETDGKETDSWTAAELAVFDHADVRVPRLERDRAIAFMLVGGSAHTTPTTADARRAERLLLPVHQAQPSDIDTLEVLGAACLKQRRGADAESWFQRALELDPRREQTLLQLGTYYQDTRQIHLAEEHLRRFLEVNPWRGEVFERYATVLALRGRWRDCVAAGRRGLELNPTLAPLHELLAYAYAQMGEPAESERHRKLFEATQKSLRRAGSPSSSEPSP